MSIMASSTAPTCTLLLLDLPAKTFVGIDLVSFNSSPKFHGIIDLPPGLHCLYTGSDASLSIRHCHWLMFGIPPSSNSYVLQWSHEKETLDLLSLSSDVAQAALRGIPSLRGRGLVEYSALLDSSSNLRAKQSPSSASQTIPGAEAWPMLCRHVIPQTLDRILGPMTTSGHSWVLSSISSAPNDAESIPGLSPEAAADVLHDNHVSTINLVPINLKQTWPDESIGRDRTDKARDRSWYLGHTIDTIALQNGANELSKNRGNGAKKLLGEMQFCFIMVLTLANYSCLEQWKRILSIIFTSRTALTEVKGFFIEAVKALHSQLERIDDVDGGLFEMDDENGSAWLRSLLKTFRESVDEILDDENSENSLSVTLSNLEKWLRETFDWADEKSLLRKGMVDLEDGERVEVQMDGLDEEEETGEYAPVVVEI